MFHEIFGISDTRAAAKRVAEIVATGFLAVIVLIASGSAAAAQQQSDGQKPPISDLAVQNSSHVAASAQEIKSILLQDAGLMVELKHSMARDATDHGQIVIDSDMTDDAIFDQLENDIQFRSVATALLQKYGYFLPKMNPDSDAAKDHKVLMEEQAKMPVRESPAQGRPQISTPSETIPAEQHPANLPNNGGDLLMQADGDLTIASPRIPSAGYSQSSQSLNNVSLNAMEASALPDREANASGPFANTSTSRNPDAARASDGLLAEFGNTLGLNAATGNFAGTADVVDQAANFSDSNPRAGSIQARGRESLLALIASPPEMNRKQSPYEDVPSLYDMYVQAVARPVTPKRFGTEIFENGTRDSHLIPMDLPVGPDYVVGPGDGLSVDLWGGVSQRLYRVVDHEGRVSLPEVGPIQVSGKSLAAVQQNLQQVLRTQFRDVSADVSLSRLRTIRVYEVGDVTNPGAYDISSLSTPLNALFAAGGPTERGSMRILNHYHGNQLVQVVDVYDLLLHGVKSDLLRLENGDTVQVPLTGPQVTVEGMVRRPAIYELRDEKSLASVLELAGGLLPTATLRHIEVQRIVLHEKQTMLSVDLPETDSDAKGKQTLDAFKIQDGDRIRIYPIAPYNQDTIYVEGHVVRPGRYSFRKDMRVTDVISSYKDLLPEPAMRYAEIIRLNAPDFHPTVEGFDLADAIANPPRAPILHAMDTVRVFSRFDFENPPSVAVMGDVRAPGTYQTSGQIRLADAVHLAGGLTPDAQVSDAQVFRYLPDGKFKIFSVDLSQALKGDPAENIILQPRDRLLIHENTNVIEPATVYVKGEVAKPGRYPLTASMHVADLIRVGGGLKPSADAQVADLTTFEWSDPAKLTGQHQTVELPAALAGDFNSNAALHNGDVLTIRQLPGWNDLGASIALKGEVKHPGAYGIRPGERLSSILERAGGFGPEAYPFGAILQRQQVRELESKSQNEIIARVKDAQTSLQLLPETDPKQKQAKEIAMTQWQEAVTQLGANPPIGRVTIQISFRIDRWKNTMADVEVRAGDILVIPKKPNYVMVTGQVFNPTAVSFRPGRSAKWYLRQSGGPTPLANKKGVFVIRADGSVIGANSSLWSGDSLSASLQPGDTVVVPEKAFGGGTQWQSVLMTAQMASSVVTAVVLALHY